MRIFIFLLRLFPCFHVSISTLLSSQRWSFALRWFDISVFTLSLRRCFDVCLWLVEAIILNYISLSRVPPEKKHGKLYEKRMNWKVIDGPLVDRKQQKITDFYSQASNTFLSSSSLLLPLAFSLHLSYTKLFRACFASNMKNERLPTGNK